MLKCLQHEMGSPWTSKSKQRVPGCCTCPDPASQIFYFRKYLRNQREQIVSIAGTFSHGSPLEVKMLVERNYIDKMFSQKLAQEIDK